jgi:hypothetical protein
MKFDMKSLRWGSSGREVIYVLAPGNRRSLVRAEELQEQTITGR